MKVKDLIAKLQKANPEDDITIEEAGNTDYDFNGLVVTRTNFTHTTSNHQYVTLYVSENDDINESQLPPDEVIL